MDFNEVSRLVKALDRIADAIESIAAGQATAPAGQVDNRPAPGFNKFMQAKQITHKDTNTLAEKWAKDKSALHPIFRQLVSDCLNGGATLADATKAMVRQDCLPSLPPWEFVTLIELERAIREY